MSRFNKKTGVSGIKGTEFETLAEFCDRVGARNRVMAKKHGHKPPLTRQPFAAGTLKERKYRLKKRWNSNEISTRTYFEFLLDNGYPLTVAVREIGLDNVKLYFEIMQTEAERKEQDAVPS